MVERWRALLGLAAFCSSVGCASAAHPPKSALDSGPTATFEVSGEPLCFVGTNNYYLTYKPKQMVDGVLESARAMGVKVVRLWAFIDRGSLDGSVPSIDGDGTKDGHYFQAWDPAQRHAVYNDGPNGLETLDYALAKASSLDLKVVLVLTNNWRDFGGMDQYLAWYGVSAHQDFYTDPAIKQAYKDWVSHLVSRVNVITQRAYRDDPTIFAWELANEPRAASGTPSSVINDWAFEMSSYLKSIDAQHLVAVGDEGFFEQPGSRAHWTYHADNGVDHRALSALPSVDYGTFHMYPDTWGTGFAWPERWIDDHLRVARELGKPTVLEEYGLKVVRDELGRVSEGLDARLASYQAWNERVLAGGGNAAMFWLLAGNDEHGGAYPDYDHFSVYPGDESSSLLQGFARRFATAAPACANAVPSTTSNTSPFVHVRGRRLSAFGWRASDG
jgi:mannan endo-1,4-beta-mannosidase